MNRIKFIAFGSLIFLASCASRKQAVSYLPADQETTLAGIIPAHATPNQAVAFEKTDELAMAATTNTKGEQTFKSPSNNSKTIAAASTDKKAHSFAQMKEMVKNGELTMSKKDLKTLNKLDKLAGGHFNNRGDDPFEMTPTAKIIAGVGAAAGVIAMLIGSWFFGFVFIVAVLAFVCRWIGIIDF